MVDEGILVTAARKIDWLEAREAVIADNIANVNTPGFAARKIQTFGKAPDAGNVVLASTNVKHIALDTDGRNRYRSEVISANETTLSGNSVNLEAQLVDQMSVAHEHATALGIFRAFHQMLMNAGK